MKSTTKELIKVALAVELDRLSCTLEDAEAYIKTAEGKDELEKVALDPVSALKSLAVLGGMSAIIPGVATGVGAMALDDQSRDSQKKVQSRQAEIAHYRQALKDLQAAQAMQHGG